VLKRAGGVVTKAAELAEVPRPSFHRMLSRARPPREGDEDDDIFRDETTAVHDDIREVDELAGS
jgi:hypothetical protein